MVRSLKIIALLLASMFIFTATADAAGVRGSNTKLEAQRQKNGVWWLFVCTRISVKDPQRVGISSSSKIGNEVINMFKYWGDRVYENANNSNWWPGKKMRCYIWYLDTKPLTKIRARMVRKFLESSGKPRIKVYIGSYSGTLRLNV